MFTAEKKITATGGIEHNFSQCAQSPLDTVVAIDYLDPMLDARAASRAKVESAPYIEMTIEGIQAFIEENNITAIEDLLTHFPIHYRTNFSLVEHTRATGESNLEFPRIVVFGADGRFLLNIGTKPDDPMYNKLDVAQLHTDTGQWEFSVFDFDPPSPTLTRNDPSCAECHGTHNARPIWGTNAQWIGVFGDNIARGPQAEALHETHLEKMLSIIEGEGGSPRFEFLKWDDQPLIRGGKRRLANHAFGAELLLSNLAMGSATSLGSYLRLKQHAPEQYQALREELLLAYYLKKGNAFLSESEKAVFEALVSTLDSSIQAFSLPEVHPYQEGHPNFEKVNKPIFLEKISFSYSASIQKDKTLDKLLTGLGVNPAEAFSLATLSTREKPSTHWSMGAGDLYDMLMLQVLDDLRRDNPEVDQILRRRVVEEAIFNCPMTASNISEVVDYKMMHLFYLSGKSRYDVHEVFYPLDVEDIYDRVFMPVAHDLIGYLKSSSSTEI
ncbi:hypothetical protein GCM10007877_14530 [Marinibactrum halimedae]|uniref:Cytochrome c domain-containing protein n=1 Tax=Marinibactrum halimedae TaxID=1444977 RepID=A0AA37T2K9_9GAMM|nr:hypothetical protein GCM10007877_14530 [Marinibactrum halimedae]